MSEPPFDFSEGPLRIGSTFRSKYHVDSLLGQGGHAWVYGAHDTLLGRGVAIKVVYRPGGASAEMLERGLREVKILCQLQHPNIVRMYDAELVGGVLYIVMERLQGRSLRDTFAQHGHLEPEEMLAIVEPVAEALHVAHLLGVIHRDIKPENIFICEDGVVKVLDFGVAKVMNASVLTQPDALVGTIYYMAPEQLQDRPVSPSTDLYSLAVVLYEGLAGRHPVIHLIKSPNASMWDVSKLIVMRNPIELHKLDPRISFDVSDFVSKGMAKKESQRHPSALDFAAAARLNRETLLADLARQGRSPVERDLARGGLPSSGVKESLRSTHPVPSMMTAVVAEAKAIEHVEAIAASAADAGRRVWPLPAQTTAPLGSLRLYVVPSTETNEPDGTWERDEEDLEHPAETREETFEESRKTPQSTFEEPPQTLEETFERPAETPESEDGHEDRAPDDTIVASSARQIASAQQGTDLSAGATRSAAVVPALRDSGNAEFPAPSGRDELHPHHEPARPLESALPLQPPLGIESERPSSFGSRRLPIARPLGILLAVLLGCDLGIALASLVNRSHTGHTAPTRSAPSTSRSAGPKVPPQNTVATPPPPVPSVALGASLAAAEPLVSASSPSPAVPAPAPTFAKLVQTQKRLPRVAPQRPKAAPAPSASATVRPPISHGDLPISSGLDGPPLVPIRPDTGAPHRSWIVPAD